MKMQRFVWCVVMSIISVMQSIRDALTAFTIKLENLKITAGLVGNQVCAWCLNLVCIVCLLLSRGGVVTVVERTCLPIGERSVCSVKLCVKC